MSGGWVTFTAIGVCRFQTTPVEDRELFVIAPKSNWYNQSFKYNTSTQPLAIHQPSFVRDYKITET